MPVAGSLSSLCVKADPGPTAECPRVCVAESPGACAPRQTPAPDCVCKMGHGHSFSEVLHCWVQGSTAGVPCRSLTWKVQSAPLGSWHSMGEIERGLIAVSDQERVLVPSVEDRTPEKQRRGKRRKQVLFQKGQTGFSEKGPQSWASTGRGTLALL